MRKLNPNELRAVLYLTVIVLVGIKTYYDTRDIPTPHVGLSACITDTECEEAER